jgi:hypothetical protein
MSYTWISARERATMSHPILAKAVFDSCRSWINRFAEAQAFIDHFLRLCHRVAYPTEKVFQFIDMLQGQNTPKFDTPQLVAIPVP